MQQQLQPNTLLHGETYRIEKVLGQGSFGITYLAEHINLGKKVAIKEFFMKELNNRGDDGSITNMSDSTMSQNYYEKFKKEAINLSRLDHPNIVRVTDSFNENGTFYYVMDYIEGENLNDYIKTRRIGEKRIVEIISSVADALIYMHEEKKMLHLDLKPGNIMINEKDGHVCLIDFGLSKHYSIDGQPETSTSIGLGTAGYAPIEQATKAKNGEFRPTIDVYALGATLYKLLTRETPPAASDLVSDDELLEDNLRAKGVSDNLINVITEAMCPNVRKRTQTIRDFKANLLGTANAAASAKTTYQTTPAYQRVAPSSEETMYAAPQNSTSPVDEETIYEDLDEDSATSAETSLLDWHGRVGRLMYFLTWAGSLVVFYLLIFIFAGITAGILKIPEGTAFFAIVLGILFYYVNVVSGIKRCHDLGCSGWFILIPFYGLYALFAKGADDDDNGYGIKPKRVSRKSLILVGEILAGIFVFSLIIVNMTSRRNGAYGCQASDIDTVDTTVIDVVDTIAMDNVDYDYVDTVDTVAVGY